MGDEQTRLAMTKKKGETTTSQGSLCVTASEAKQSQNQRIRDCFARRKNEFAMTSPLVVARAESPKQPRSSGVLLRLLRKRDYELAVTPFPSSRASLSQSFRVFLLWSFRAHFFSPSEPFFFGYPNPSPPVIPSREAARNLWDCFGDGTTTSQ
jgi:hypothetical protein